MSRGTFEEKWLFWNQYNSIRFSEYEPKILRLLVKIFWKVSQNCIQRVQKYFLNSIHLFDIFSLNHFRFLGDKLSTVGLWKPQFRCPEEDIAEIFLWKKRFSHYFRKKVSELSHFRQKNPDRLAKKGLHVPGETFWGTILFLKLFYKLNFFVIWAQDSQLFSGNFQAVLLKPPNAWLKKPFKRDVTLKKNVFFFKQFRASWREHFVL